MTEQYRRQEQEIAFMKTYMIESGRLAVATETRRAQANQEFAPPRTNQELCLDESIAQSTVVNDRSDVITTRWHANEKPQDGVDHAQKLRKASIDPPLILNLRPRLCNPACTCNCHSRNAIRSPSFLNRILGSLFMSYQGSPWSTQACNSPDCRKSVGRLTYTYAFPRWLLHRIVVMHMAYSQIQGPELVLRVWRVCPYNAIILGDYRTSDREEERCLVAVERSLSNGAASLLDVDPDGATLLHVRYYHLRLENVYHLMTNDSMLCAKVNSGSQVC